MRYALGNCSPPQAAPRHEKALPCLNKQWHMPQTTGQIIQVARQDTRQQMAPVVNNLACAQSACVRAQAGLPGQNETALAAFVQQQEIERPTAHMVEHHHAHVGCGSGSDCDQTASGNNKIKSAHKKHLAAYHDFQNSACSWGSPGAQDTGMQMPWQRQSRL